MAKKKILMFAHYYPPDVASTGQILQGQAEGMLNDFDVTVICTVPSYTGHIKDEYKEKRVYKEEINGVHVVRVPVPEFTKSSKRSRIGNLLTYFVEVKKFIRKAGIQDYVFAVSQPPIMGGMLGVFGKNKLQTQDGKKPKLIYAIQDFNPEQIEAVGFFKNKFVLNLMRWLDKRSCRKSDLIITVGRDLVDTLKKRFIKGKIPNHIMINNWIDEKVIYPLSADNPGVVNFKQKYGIDGKYIIMYSGNIGLYYDLEGIIKIIAQFKGVKTPDGRDVIFAFVGAGSVLDKLIQFKDKNKISNVIFIPYQEKDKLIYSLNAADVHWCVNAKGIKGVSCPSKFYGICGVRKPILGVLEYGSEIQMLINEIGCGKCSEPGDYEAMQKNIDWFISRAGSMEIAEMANRGYNYLLKNLTKDVSIAKYVKAIKEI